ncbi:MAG: ATP-binding cassette domain-containing protein [Gemmatimonadota bacterium]|jgi:phospholipid/cholesterol/gamma-HCH transport system ATP-binding protein
MSIEMVNVHKAFGEKEVLKGFTLTIPDGETVSVVGGSGSGKSVALKHIVGLIRPDEGDVWIDGDNVSRLDRESVYELRRNVGYVFQFAALFDSMTVAENVGMGLRRIPDMEDDAIDERVLECLHLVDLEGYGDRLPSELSGGQRKRAGFARAIATKPKYLLYDEPTTGLDPVTTAVIDELMIRMAEELGVTGVVITHDMKSAYRISDRVAMLYDGRIRFVGTPDEMQNTEDPVVKGFVEGRPALMESAL